MRAYKFRIYPSKSQEKLLGSHLWISKELWNELLAFTKEVYKNHGKFPTKATLREMAKTSGLYSQVSQELVDRLSEATWRKAKKQQRGFPRFKSFDRMKSLVYPQFGFSLENKLNVTPFGNIPIKKHREIRGCIKTLTLKREATGKWFAILSVEKPKEEAEENSGEAVGIDFGLLNFATLSNAKVIGNPRHVRKYEDRLAFSQRELSRKKKRGKNRQRAKLKVARIHEKVTNTRRDFLHKLSNELVHTYSFIALEKLASQEMAEQNFGKSINDAGWNMFANMLCYKAEEAGSRVIFVDAKDTTKECSNCGTKTDKALGERMHDCPNCSLRIDRDLNAALVILKRATVGTTGSNASGDERMLSSMKEDATRFSGW